MIKAILTSIVLGVAMVTATTPEEPDYSKFVEPVITYTEDSVVLDVLELEPVAAPDKTVSIKFNFDFSMGYTVYDNPETPYIDGLKVNGEWLTEYIYHNYDYTKPFEVTVKTAYKTGLEGILARIADGTYDYTELLGNPIMVFQMVYYGLAIVSVLGALISLIFGRKRKVKDSHEIASEVGKEALNIKKSANDALDNITVAATNVITDVVTPVVNKLMTTNAAVVKAVILANSKAENASADLLNVLNEVSAVDCDKIIEEAKTGIVNSVKALSESKQKVLDELNDIKVEPSSDEPEAL